MRGGAANNQIRCFTRWGRELKFDYIERTSVKCKFKAFGFATEEKLKERMSSNNHTASLFDPVTMRCLLLGFSLNIASIISIEPLSLARRCKVESVGAMEGKESWEIRVISPLFVSLSFEMVKYFSECHLR